MLPESEVPTRRSARCIVHRVHAWTWACLPTALQSTVLLGPDSKRFRRIRKRYLERIWSHLTQGEEERRGEGRRGEEKGGGEGKGKLHVSDLDLMCLEIRLGGPVPECK